MEMYATTVYVIADEVLRLLNVNDDPQSKMSNAEVITFAIVSAKFFSGNHKLTRYLCKQLGLFPEILSNSRLYRTYLVSREDRLPCLPLVRTHRALLRQ